MLSISIQTCTILFSPKTISAFCKPLLIASYMFLFFYSFVVLVMFVFVFTSLPFGDINMPQDIKNHHCCKFWLMATQYFPLFKWKKVIYFKIVYFNFRKKGLNTDSIKSSKKKNNLYVPSFWKRNLFTIYWNLIYSTVF